MISGKIWGHTKSIISNENFEVHRIEIKPGCHCSKHKHNYKYNMFYVEQGFLKVKVWKNDYNLCDVTELMKGDFTIVAPGEYHQFYTDKDCAIVYEIYYTHPIIDDIVRESCGGKE